MLSLAPYTDQDRSDVLLLWRDALPLDAITLDTLESRVLLDENFDPATFLLARRGDTLGGFLLGMAARRLPLGDADPDGTRSWITAIAVHPGESHQEIGTLLLSSVERRFREIGKKECLISPYPPGYFTAGIDMKAYRPLLEFLLASGYRQVHEALSMDAPIVLFTVPPAVIERERALLREGIDVRPYRRDDLLRFLGFLEHSMPTDWVRVERANLRKISTGGFHPDQVTLVVKDGDIIGYCQFEGSHFGPFGVSEQYQGKGIGTVLLARTIERMRHHGYHTAWVMWTDDVAAKVYRKFGFTETRRFAILKKTL